MSPYQGRAPSDNFPELSKSRTQALCWGNIWQMARLTSGSSQSRVDVSAEIRPIRYRGEKPKMGPEYCATNTKLGPAPPGGTDGPIHPNDISVMPEHRIKVCALQARWSDSDKR